MTQLAPSRQPDPKDLTSQEVDSKAIATPTASTQTAILDVEGMMCAGCVSTVEKKLSQCEGVTAATVNLVTEIAAIEYADQTDPQAIAQALTDAGYPSKLRETQNTAALSAETDWLIRKENEQKNQRQQLIVAGGLLLLSTIGHLQHVEALSQWTRIWQQIPVLNTLWFHGTLATLVLLFPARQILVEGFQGARRGSPNMNTLVSLGALSAYTTSLAALIFPQLGWECFFDEPVMLLSFILLGRTLEQRARFQAAGSLRSLIALQPTLARLIPHPGKTDNKTDHASQAASAGVQIPAAQVQVGEWLRVLPGEKVPVDGVITAGKTTVDESMLTGESIAVAKQPGDEVVAGSLNQSGAIALQVSRTGTDTTLGQMIQLVETAQTRKAPIQGLADSISGYFTYGVLTCAALTFCFWYFWGCQLWPELLPAMMGRSHHTAPAMTPEVPEMAIASTGRLLVSLKLAIAVVVVACPCALGLATPTAILVGSGIGAQKGLLIRGGDILEATHGLDTIVFDKTGTLTTGQPHLTDCLAINESVEKSSNTSSEQPFALSSNELLQIAATVESGTRHPVGNAIERAAKDKALPLLLAQHFATEAGFGIAADIELTQLQTHVEKERRVCVGNAAWMHQNNCQIDPASQQTANTWEQAGKTVVFVALDDRLAGLIAVADELRPDAVQTVKDLRSLGLSVRVLSGDSMAAAQAIAQPLNLSPEHIQAAVTPQGKVEAISQLQKAGHKVGLVGDGINDAPALAQADVGIALASGTEVAMETADIVLMNDQLSNAIAALRLSRATFNKIRQNLAWAFTYNLICIPLAAGVFLPSFGLSLNPGFAGGLMALSSVIVVVNSLLLKRQKL